MTTSTDLVSRGPSAQAVTDPARNPRVIDGEVTDSWFPRPMLPMLVSSGALFAMGLAALIQEATR